ncbi:hypothetical protein Pd630_LPD01306 [Rhodococcus opacus PD630]|nr:hypothetical protein Pd630_LPD01306 [Rhodococcus opacus PD630]
MPGHVPLGFAERLGNSAPGASPVDLEGGDDPLIEREPAFGH